MDKTAICNLARDLRSGVKSFSIEDKTYSSAEATDILRQALIDANGGSDKFDRKAFRRNKVEIFELIEELVPNIIQEGLTGDEFWMNYVDERNLALGDENVFEIPANTTFIVSEMADGIATPRRQRIGERTKLPVTTTLHGVRIYEEFTRFMAGRIDWNDLCARVAKSFQQEIWNDIFTAFNGITASTIGLNSTYVKSGTYDESALITLIAHVEAANDQPAVIVGTRAALAKVTAAVLSDEAKSNMFNEGFYGKLRGTPMIALKQKHIVGTDTFILDDSKIYVVAGGEKFVKYVTEGDAYIEDKPSTTNADMSIEYLMTTRYGIGIAFTGRFGQYTITG